MIRLWSTGGAPVGGAPRGGGDGNRPLHLKRRLLTSGIGALLLLFLWGLCGRPEFVETAYAGGAGDLASRLLAAVSGVAPASVAEVCVIVLLLWVLARAAIAAVRVARGRRRLANAIACGTLRGGSAAVVLAVSFYALWGMNYARPDAARRLGWEGLEAAPAPGESAIEELSRLVAELVDESNRHYETLHGAADLGVASSLPADVRALDAQIDAGFARAAQRLGIEDGLGVSRGRAKPLLLSALTTRLGLAGFYFPFTGEASYNRDVPSCELPHVLAHEKAHQRCVASEDEANFFGFLACVHSPDPFVRYAGYLFAQRQLLHELDALDPERARELRATRLPGVARDIDDARAFWKRHQGAASALSHRINDRYLKLNGVEAGVDSYRLSARLLVLFSRSRAGSAVVPASEEIE
jgi:hypothetical protein